MRSMRRNRFKGLLPAGLTIGLPVVAMPLEQLSGTDSGISWVLLSGVGVLLLLLGWLHQYRTLNSQLQASHSVIDRHVLLLEMDLDGRVTNLSQALSQHSGHSPTVLEECSATVLWPREMLDYYHEQLQRVIRTHEVWHGEVEQIKAYGEHYLAALTITPRLDHRGNLVGITEIRRDITDSKRIEQLSVTDELTGLANRRSFNQQFKSELERARRSRSPLCLAILDVDCFKGYNDTYGHQAGDLALKQVGQLLSGCLRRASDFSYRLGGEEFALLFSPINEADVKQVLEGVRAVIQKQEIKHNTNTAAEVLTISIGYCLIALPAGNDPEVIYQQADQMLYKAKTSGRNQVCGTVQSADLSKTRRSTA